MNPLAYQQPTRVIVTSDDASLLTAASRGRWPNWISFVDAFNSGDQAVLSRIFFLSEGPSLRILRTDLRPLVLVYRREIEPAAR